MGRSSRDRRDIFYRLAKEEGWRARSAYKLLQLDDHFQLLNDVSRVVDLCAAPGSWSQVISQRLSGKDESKILAIDLQKMADIPGVIEIQDDITSQSAVDKVLFHFDGRKADLVVCDGAPDVIGRNDFDEFIQDQLLLASLRISVQILKPGGDFVAKIFRGKEVSLMAAHLSAFFEKVTMAKPGSCRTSSIESFVVCQNFKPPCDSSSFQQFIDQQVLHYFKSGSPRTVIPFASCKSAPFYDPDMNHPLQIGSKLYTYREPTQKPIDPPYKQACDAKKSGIK